MVTLLSMWILVASMAAYFHAMQLAYGQHVANATVAAPMSFWGKVRYYLFDVS